MNKGPRILSLIALFLLTASLTETVSGPQQPNPNLRVNIEGDHLALSTETTQVTFALDEKGRLAGLQNTLTQQELNLTNHARNCLWMMETDEGLLSSCDAQAFSYRLASQPDSTTIHMNWRLDQIQVEAKIAPDQSTRGFNFWIEASSQDETTIKRVFFPYIGGVIGVGESPHDDLIALPEREGYMIQEVRDSLLAQGRGFTYPGTLSMQFLLLYEQGKGGFYLATHDPQSNFKGIELLPDSQESYKLNYFHYPQRIAPGNTIEPTYPVTISAFEGNGWEAGAEIYKRWALRQWYVEKGALSQRKDVPQWLRDTDVVWKGGSYNTDIETGDIVLAGEHMEDMGQYAREVKELLPGTNILLEWWGWMREGHDKGYPEYYPPRDGEQALKKGIEEAHREGVRVMLFLNGRLIDTNTENFREYEDYLARDEQRRPHLETYDRLTGAVVCPATRWWKTLLTNISVRAVEEYGADALYLDQMAVAPPLLDYSTNHGHGVLAGDWWHSHIREILETIRAETRKRKPGVAIVSENVNEVYIGSVDAFLSNDAIYNFRGWYPKGRMIPMFSYVYHPYALQLGRQEVTPKDGSGIYHFAVSESLTKGYVPGVITRKRPSRMGVEPHDVQYLKNAVDLRRTFPHFLVDGEMTQPPSFSAEDHLFNREYEHLQRDLRAPTVIASAFAAADGGVAIILSNRAPLRQHIALLPDESYGTRISIVIQNAEGKIQTSRPETLGDGSLVIPIEAYESVVVTFNNDDLHAKVLLAVAALATILLMAGVAMILVGKRTQGEAPTPDT